MFAGHNQAFLTCFAAIAIRVVKQPQFKFYPENPSDGCIYRGASNLSRFYQRFEMVKKHTTLHIHIDTGLNR